MSEEIFREVLTALRKDEDFNYRLNILVSVDFSTVPAYAGLLQLALEPEIEINLRDLSNLALSDPLLFDQLNSLLSLRLARGLPLGKEERLWMRGL